MKKLLRIFSILVFMGASLGAGAQTTVTIGSLDGAGNNSYLPPR